MNQMVKSMMKLAVIWLICFGVFTPQPAAAGNIDNTYKYAWSENSGWENFRSTYGEVTVNDAYLSGYAWAENIGWVKLGSGTGPSWISVLPICREVGLRKALFLQSHCDKG